LFFRLWASYFAFACSKESNQIKKHPLPLVSCAASKNWAAAELASLKQSSLNSPNFSKHHRRGSRGNMGVAVFVIKSDFFIKRLAK